MKSLQLGIPYQGSKRKLAGKIIDYILENNPNCKYFYDLFGGGGSISFEAVTRQKFQNVFYNEIDTGVTELLKDILKNGITDKHYQWIDREVFHENKDKATWLGGLCKTIWSFGNNQRYYLFSKDIEAYKKNYHYVIVNNENRLNEMQCFVEDYLKTKYGINQKCYLNMPDGNTYNEKRLSIRSQLTEYEKTCKQLEQLRQLQQLEQLERLQQLQQLQRLQRLQQLIILNKSYENVIITTPKKETIIYLDPPYITNSSKNSYQNPFNVNLNNQLNSFIMNCPYKVYVSGYSSPFPEVLSIQHRSRVGKNVLAIERLFCNRPDKKELSNINKFEQMELFA